MSAAKSKLQDALNALTEAVQYDMPDDVDDGLSMAMTLVAEAIAWLNAQEN